MKKTNGMYIVCVNGKTILRNATLSEADYFLNGVTVSKRQSITSALKAAFNRLLIVIAIVTLTIAALAFIA